MLKSFADSPVGSPIGVRIKDQDLSDQRITNPPFVVL
jgi:hypothetical protein